MDKIRLIIAVLRGTYYIFFFRLFRKNVRIEFPFVAFTSVNISGPGKVRIGKKCVVVENVFRGLTIVTLDQSSEVIIEGIGCLIGGLTIRCLNKVLVGKKVMTAVSLIQDVDCITTNYTYLKSENDPMNEVIINIRDNVWIGGHAIILSNTTISNDSVVAAGSVCRDINIPDYNLVSGNLARRGINIDRLMSLT